MNAGKIRQLRIMQRVALTSQVRRGETRTVPVMSCEWCVRVCGYCGGCLHLADAHAIEVGSCIMCLCTPYCGE